MPNAARKTDTITGVWSGEHNGHQDYVLVRTEWTCGEFSCWPNYIYGWVDRHQGSGTINGKINEGSSNVFINGLPACRIGDHTEELDECDEGNYKIGSVSGGSYKVFINSKGASRKGDSINTHTGSGSISGGSSNVFFG